MIKLENVNLSYPLINPGSHSLQLKLYSGFKKMIGGSLDSGRSTIHVNALKNINLEICDGQRIGIVGHNGAGKTTLLRVLAGIYTPTSGKIIAQGKIDSLTDVTLGMDMESSGIKNIIFRLVFMGFTFKQARAAIDEIVDFSELGEFVHLPVRTYSTGMFMRLAFAISTHFMPDILILDEIIGAGDEGFKKKCQERITGLLEKSRIVILSSHDMNAVNQYCNRVIMMQKGEIIHIGAPGDVISTYVG